MTTDMVDQIRHYIGVTKALGTNIHISLAQTGEAREADHCPGNNLSVCRYTTGEVTTGNIVFLPKVHQWIAALDC